jgi:VIT1/CCC1 family predicted Fe2+/Mn2+ transporter
MGGVGIFLLVVLSTFPVVIPFILMQNAVSALRLSNAIAIAMLFVAGYAYGRFVRRRPWVLGIAMILLGIVLVGLTKALGG